MGAIVTGLEVTEAQGDSPFGSRDLSKPLRVGLSLLVVQGMDRADIKDGVEALA